MDIKVTACKDCPLCGEWPLGGYVCSHPEAWESKINSAQIAATSAPSFCPLRSWGELSLYVSLEDKYV